MKKIIAKIVCGISIGMRSVPQFIALGLMYAIKFIVGMIMCLAYPFEFAYLRLTRKEHRWHKSMYFPSGLRFALAIIDFTA